MLTMVREWVASAAGDDELKDGYNDNTERCA